MSPTHHISLDLDVARVAAALARSPGTVVLRRDPHAALGWNTPDQVILFDPRWTLSVRDAAHWQWTGAPLEDLRLLRDPLALPGALARRIGRRPTSALPLVAGWVGYDLGSAAQGARHGVSAPGDPPDLWLAAFDCALVCTGAQVELVIQDASAVCAEACDPRTREERARELLRAAAAVQRPIADADPSAEVVAFDRHWHRRAVLGAQAHLRAGNSYQVNLTGFVRLRTGRSAWEVFDTECARNPVGFAAYVNTGTHEVSSHSPELLLRVREGRALTAPIKGTAVAAPGAARGLSASEKDRAEHIMIVDLCRNDLGRLARPGSVRVEQLMQPLALRGLVHLVSEISAEFGRDRIEQIFADLFPGGSITGAPKRRSCEILRDLERSCRGPYTGAIGFLDGAGGMDWNIAIRTALWHNGRAWFGCGGGIVLDSDPDREYEEAMLKAQSYLDSARGNPARERAASSSPFLSGAHDTVVAPADGAP